MGKGKRGHGEVDTYEEDDFVENDDGAAKKKTKTKSASGSGSEDKFWELSNGRNPRRINVQEFKGNKLISIREYYEKDGEYKPGSKGVSLTIDQYKNLLAAIPELNTHLKTLGVDVSELAIPEDGPVEETNAKKRVKAKKEKANIEATSDEDEE